MLPQTAEMNGERNIGRGGEDITRGKRQEATPEQELPRSPDTDGSAILSDIVETAGDEEAGRDPIECRRDGLNGSEKGGEAVDSTRGPEAENIKETVRETTSVLDHASRGPSGLIQEGARRIEAPAATTEESQGEIEGGGKHDEDFVLERDGDEKHDGKGADSATNESRRETNCFAERRGDQDDEMKSLRLSGVQCGDRALSEEGILEQGTEAKEAADTDQVPAPKLAMSTCGARQSIGRELGQAPVKADAAAEEFPETSCSPAQEGLESPRDVELAPTNLPTAEHPPSRKPEVPRGEAEAARKQSTMPGERLSGKGTEHPVKKERTSGKLPTRRPPVSPRRNESPTKTDRVPKESAAVEQGAAPTPEPPKKGRVGKTASGSKRKKPGAKVDASSEGSPSAPLPPPSERGEHPSDAAAVRQRVGVDHKPPASKGEVSGVSTEPASGKLDTPGRDESLTQTEGTSKEPAAVEQGAAPTPEPRPQEQFETEAPTSKGEEPAAEVEANLKGSPSADLPPPSEPDERPSDVAAVRQPVDHEPPASKGEAYRVRQKPPRKRSPRRKRRRSRDGLGKPTHSAFDEPPSDETTPSKPAQPTGGAGSAFPLNAGEKASTTRFPGFSVDRRLEETANVEAEEEKESRHTSEKIDVDGSREKERAAPEVSEVSGRRPVEAVAGAAAANDAVPTEQPPTEQGQPVPPPRRRLPWTFVILLIIIIIIVLLWAFFRGEQPQVYDGPSRLEDLGEPDMDEV